MPVIHVVKPFMLQLEHGKLTEYIVGRYEVTDEVAKHWYVQAHIEGFVEPPPATGTEQQAVLLATQAARLNESVEKQEDKQMPPLLPPRNRTVQFAGRRDMPKEPNQTPTFIDPRA
jgi:hypothetical protein